MVVMMSMKGGDVWVVVVVTSMVGWDVERW